MLGNCLLARSLERASGQEGFQLGSKECSWHGGLGWGDRSFARQSPTSHASVRLAESTIFASSGGREPQEAGPGSCSLAWTSLLPPHHLGESLALRLIVIPYLNSNSSSAPYLLCGCGVAYSPSLCLHLLWMRGVVWALLRLGSSQTVLMPCVGSHGAHVILGSPPASSS